MEKEKKPKDTFTGEAKPKEAQKVSRSSKVQVIFRENRKFDLHIGRDMITFNAREAKMIPRDWLKHRDFKQVQKYFIVKGV